MNKLIFPALLAVPLVLGGLWIFLSGEKESNAAVRLAALGPGLTAPIECSDPNNCVVQNHVDLSGPNGVSDPACGARSYNGHQGVDFRIRDIPMMMEGVDVVSAADGKVVRARDGEFDGAWAANRRDVVAANLCGNGVLVDHGEGFMTQYCQLRRDSISVKDGEWIKRGQKIGQVGMSGRAEFPHLHFQVMKEGKRIDPFTGRGIGEGCGQAVAQVWNTNVPDHWNPASGPFVFKGGFTDRQIALPLIDRGLPLPTRESQAIVFYARSIWLKDGDLQEIQLEGPPGFEPVALKEEAVKGDKAQAFRFVGRPKTEEQLAAKEPFPAGVYRGRYRVKRGGDVIADFEQVMELR